jgi:hypothetical protein
VEMEVTDLGPCRYCADPAICMVGTTNPARRSEWVPHPPEPRCIRHLQGPGKLGEDAKREAEAGRKAKVEA